MNANTSTSLQSTTPTTRRYRLQCGEHGRRPDRRQQRVRRPNRSAASERTDNPRRARPRDQLCGGATAICAHPTGWSRAGDAPISSDSSGRAGQFDVEIVTVARPALERRGQRGGTIAATMNTRSVGRASRRTAGALPSFGERARQGLAGNRGEDRAETRNSAKDEPRSHRQHDPARPRARF